MNTQLWNLYKSTEQGKKAISLFDIEQKEDKLKNFEEIIDYMASKNDYTNLSLYWLCVYIDNIVEFFKLSQEPINREKYQNLILEYDICKTTYNENCEVEFDEDEIWVRQDDYRTKCSEIPILSMLLYILHPNDFKPIFYKTNFPIILQNCDALGIEIPPIPHTKDYKQYLMYYYDLCQAWNEFQKANNLTNAEFCACLYDFAPMNIEQHKQIELPKPTNVWLVGAAPGDFLYLDSKGKEKGQNPEGIWQCNEKTNRGDLVVIYCRSPRSYIHSIWRADSDGRFNPFDCYQCRTTVCNGVKIPPITIKEMREDPYLSQIPIVRKNLQGVNGVELSPKDYAEIARFLKERGNNPNVLPKLFEINTINVGEIAIEKDVEEKILIPILKQLGYTENNWTRQLSQKAGRGLKAIPDFVFFPEGEKHFASSPFVIEAKYDMSSMTERINAFSQCLSYARMLRSKLMAICDKERLIIYKVDEDGMANRNDPIFEEHWANIYSDQLIGANLNQIIGREVVEKLKETSRK